MIARQQPRFFAWRPKAKKNSGKQVGACPAPIASHRKNTKISPDMRYRSDRTNLRAMTSRVTAESVISAFVSNAHRQLWCLFGRCLREIEEALSRIISFKIVRRDSVGLVEFAARAEKPV